MSRRRAGVRSASRTGRGTSLFVPGVPSVPAGPPAGGPQVDLTYSSPGGMDGVVNWYGTNRGTVSYANPAKFEQGSGQIAALYSSTHFGGNAALGAMDHGTSGIVHTADAPDSWVAYRLPVGHSLKPTDLAIQQRADASSQLLEGFTLEGSNDGTTWTSLYTRAASTPAWAQGAWERFPISTSTSYRWFRIRQLGSDSSNTNYLVFSELELWGELTYLEPPATPAPKLYTAESAADGVVNWYGTAAYGEAFTNPATTRGPAIVATESSKLVAHTGADQAMNRGTNPYHSDLEAGAWAAWQLPAGDALSVDFVAIKSRSDAPNNLLRTFYLEGSNDGATWSTLLARTSGTEWAQSTWKAFPVYAVTAYERFRIRLHGTSSSGENYLVVDEIELWGELTTS